MSWLRNSPLRTNFSRQRSRDSPPKDADPTACYDSFRKHWQQTHDIILQTKPPTGIPSHDDVRGVVNHVDQMVTLLLLELRNATPPNEHRRTATPTHSPCLEHLLNENLLDKLYEWSLHTGRFNNAVWLEQLKLYELLVSHSGALLAHEPVARPLLRLLEQCADDVMLPEVEKKLVVLLNQLCVALMQNMALLDLFFHPTSNGKSKFIIFTLLIPHIHKEGGVGQQARDAMLLCMSLSKKNDEVGFYIADHSNVCPVLATGLSGLYSLLPRKLDIETEDWHRLTPDDVNDMPALTQLMNSLEFCNAVAQVAHPVVQKQILEFLYQGFLLPVMGPALLQESLGLTIEQLDAPQHWTAVDELVAATAYFDLFLRSVTEPGLLRSLIRFLLEDNYDECRILDSLIQRISSRSRLCIVTLALFETLVELNCEDVMLELCLGALTPCSHIMISQRRRLRDIDPFGRAAEKFLSLTPNCCATGSTISMSPNSLPNVPGISHLNNSTFGAESFKSLPIPINYGARLSESLYGNYHAYLCDARQKIANCQRACSNWSSQYDGETLNETNSSIATILPEENTLIERTVQRIESNQEFPAESVEDTRVQSNICKDPSVQIILDNIESLLTGEDVTVCKEDISKPTTEEKTDNVLGTLSFEEQAKLDADIAELLNEDIGTTEQHTDDTLQLDKKGSDSGIDESNTAMNSLLSLGESSGYESFAFKGSSESTPDNEPSEDRISEHEEAETTLSIEPSIQLHGITNVINVTNEGSISNRQSKDSSTYHQDIFNGQPNVGIFLDVVLRKLECMTNNSVYVNLHLTGLLSRLAIYPQPLLRSFLLNHSLVFQPSIRSLLQVLASLKHKIDQFLSRHHDIHQLVEQARTFLIGREDRLVNARKNALEASAQAPTPRRYSSASEPFTRGEPKRRSLTSSLSQIFKRSGGYSGPSSLSGSISQPSSISEDQWEIAGDNCGPRYHTKISWESPKDISPVQNIVLCAVVLDEWVKELAAITQEHAIASLTNGPEFRL
ncbi:FHIP family protein CPIJ015043-like isoform X2 [Diprion similis]|uniref:FHIP family protein CPIJ015043-like isoform X2 n=1 Tax=Diprion similis TaxID=362088 RepID=UPI001EF9981E|nr:FHIP family protein CPIJ015043-like isoform X2 [Diprion similis]